MLLYIVKRILIFIPTLFLISILAFVISVNSPADPVEQLTRAASMEGGVEDKNSAENSIKNEIRKKLGLDLPLFYMSLASWADCDTLHLIPEKKSRENLSRLVKKYGNWQNVQNYNHQLIQFHNLVKTTEYTTEQLEISTDLSFLVLNLQQINQHESINQNFVEINTKIQIINNSSLQIAFQEVKKSYEYLVNHSGGIQRFLPKLKINGLQNQYHLWLFGDIGLDEKRGKNGVLMGDFGNSYSDNQPIIQKIGSKFFYSFILVMLSIFISYLVSIPLGIYAAYKKDQKFDRISSVLVFMLYSLPGYFVGTILLYWFANPDNFVWFPIGGVKDASIYQENWSVFQKISHQAPYFVLPLITYTYSSFAFISRMIRGSMVEVLQQDYIRTARAKGLSEKRVILVHALRNSLLPIITMIADVFPAALGGSVILETIFSIPGLGLEIYTAVISTDIPMIVAVFTLTGLLTVVGYLVSDILYAIVDPRITIK
jgi:peptide/nickel transport system permease protein